MHTQLVSKYLQLMRKKHDLTQEDLAQKLNLSRQAVSKWETGNTVPDLETLLKLSKLYHISINDILEPKIPPDVIEDFEQIIEIPQTALTGILSNFTANDPVKASMGASPAVYEFLNNLLPDIDFEQTQNEIGRLKVTDVEEIQHQITAMINLRMAATEKQLLSSRQDEVKLV